ncbi:hypothetical protein BKA01_004018 [Pseudonocardia eucalypti]|uniref:hypothetical protein n=1 Tax=Pseudonocardia eucalypti TaxID=648755 RepID=UPI001614A01D|nr:hypothetical protein [Pseudonocardia eucalypti]
MLAVVCLGELPRRRKLVRTATGSGWVEIGSFASAQTPPMPWARVGLCQFGRSHPVVPANL